MTKLFKSVSSKTRLASAVAITAAAFAQPSLAQIALEEVIVTAQKRSQSMQDVPVAVTAFDAESLRASGVDDITDLNTANPSFNINVQQNKVSNSPARIRGVGTTGTNPAFEGAVGLYVDGVYRSRSGMVLATFNDIGSLEILRGPQGTLFGKNTSAGALVLNSTTPSQEFEAGVAATLGNYNTHKISGYVNQPISDDLIARIAVLSNTSDGFIDNPVTGNNVMDTDTQSAKVQIAFTPSDELSVRVIGDYTEADELCCYAMAGRLNPELDAQNPADAIYAGWTSGAAYYDQTGNTFDRNFGNNFDGTDRSRDWGLSLDINYDLNDELSLRSISSYREYTNNQQNGDWDFSQVDLANGYNQRYEFETITQEFNLSGSYDSVEFVLGAFYSKEDLHHEIQQGAGEFLGENFALTFTGVAQQFTDGAAALRGAGLEAEAVAAEAQAGLLTALAALPADQLARPGTYFNDSAFDHSDEVLAAYGHFTFSVTEELNLIAGLRYSSEEKDLDRVNRLANNNLDMLAYMAQNQVGFLALGTTHNGPSRSDSLKEEELTYTAGIQYFVNDDIQTYLNYSRGYKAGGISITNDAGGQLVSIDNFPLLLAGAITSPDQVLLTPASDAQYAPEYVDAYELGIKADYFEGRGRLNLALFRSEFDDIQANSFTGTGFVTYNASTAVTEGFEIENTFALSDSWRSMIAVTHLSDASFGDQQSNRFAQAIAGMDIEFAPEWAGNVRFQYDGQLTDDIGIYGVINGSYTGSHLLSNEQLTRDEYFLVGLTAGARLMDEALDVALSCRNCADEEYSTEAFASPVQVHKPVMTNPGAPRIVELTVRYTFGY